MTKYKKALTVSVLPLLLALLAGLTYAEAPGEGGGGYLPLGGGWEPGGTITITAPTNISNFPLVPGVDNTAQGTLTVNADAAWSVSVLDASADTLGKMTNYTSGQYNTSVKLGAFMGVRATGDNSTGSTVTLPAGGMIAQNITGGTGGSVVDVPIIFNQTVSWTDKVSAPDCVYRIVVTFTGEVA
jgi:hypothetical protein